jgi:hypothetical protein
MSTKAGRPQARHTTSISAAIKTLPNGIAIRYAVRPPNRAIKLYSGAFLLTDQKEVWRLRGNIQLTWLPEPTVRFHGSVTSGGHVERLGKRLELRIPARSASATVSISGTTWGSRPAARGAVERKLRFGRDYAVRAIRFHVPNFHDYVGKSVRFVGERPTWLANSRLSLSHRDWMVHIDQDPQFHKMLDLLRVHGGYAIGHAGMLERRDGKRFCAADAAPVITCLHRFLSFARGLWCGPIIQEGIGTRATVWTEWLSRAFAVDWRSVSSWFPVHDTQMLSVAFDGFADLWEDPLWSRPLREATYWYLAANMNAAAVEGGLVLAHATLELLSWTYIVGQRQLYSPKDFDDRSKFSAAKRIEALLRELKIPTSLPPLLPSLRGWARGAANGPRAITDLRNALVHPTPPKRGMLESTPARAKSEANDLALWYVELVLLALSRYEGKYVNRLRRGVSVEAATEVVPWMLKKSITAAP